MPQNRAVADAEQDAYVPHPGVAVHGVNGDLKRMASRDIVIKGPVVGIIRLDTPAR